MRFDVRELNVLKNRTKYPSASEINPAITLAAMSALGEDRERFKSSDAATVTGYVTRVSAGGVETANCKSRDVDGRDTHINIVANPADANDPAKQIIVEVTPRLRALAAANGEDWRTRTLQHALVGHVVTVTGWLMFDSEHASASANTAPPDRSVQVWRATAWEIHPITQIQIEDAQP